MSRIYVAVDLETTGFSPERDAILEIGAVKFRVPEHPDEDPIIERWQTLVHPGRPIPHRISQLTGITQADLDHAPPLHRVIDEFRAFVGNYPVIGHNVGFELAFLQKQNVLVGQAHLDTFELASLLWPYAPRYTLGDLATFIGVPFEGWHRALADSEMTMHLFLALWRAARTLPHGVLEAIVQVVVESRWSLRSFFAAAHRAEGDGGIPIPMPPPRAEPPAPHHRLVPIEHPTPLPHQEILSWIEANSPLSANLPHFTVRPAQKAMLEAILRALSNETHLIVEGGTGAGKSLAYSLAAIYEAQRRNMPVVISTNTLNLQDQLYYQDLPRLAEALPRPFTVQRLKGRSNYLCTRRLALLQQRGKGGAYMYTPAEARLVARVLIWKDITTSGDRSELNLQREEEEAWAQICGDSASCKPDVCSPFGACYWSRAHERAQNAHLVIVNHALLLNDIAAGGGLIPEAQSVMIDEAHHLEAQATQQFGFTVQQGQFDALLAALGREERGKSAGLLAQMGAEAKAGTSRVAQFSKVNERAGLLLRQVEQCRSAVETVFTCLFDLLHNLPRHAQDSKRRIDPVWRQWAEWHPLKNAIEQLVEEVDAFAEGINQLMPTLMVLSAKEIRWQSWTDEVRRLTGLISENASEIKRILLEPDPNDVGWLTIRASDEDEEDGPGDVAIHRAPISVAELMEERLFTLKRSVILTSATLGVEGSFGYIKERLGITRTEELSVGSPYHFESQVLTYVVNDLPEPNQQHYAQNLQRALIELARATEGRLLVLFTSKSQLNQSYRAISAPLAREDITVIAQYMDGSRTHLLERFQTMERAVLLGTHSFWEGIDIPGAALSCVAITRLPFPVPNDPIHAARSEAYRDAFNEYMVPQAVIRFRQGFGRLIRSEEDRGIVAILDSRIDSKSYGSAFLHSLPPTTLHIGPLRDLSPIAERWLRQ